MRETVAHIEIPDQTLSVGDIYEIPIENEEFGRISAQMAKQIIIQKLREAEREKVYQQFIDKEGTLIHGIVRRHERGNTIIDIGDGVEATILKNDMIPRESLRIGDRILGYLQKVNRELKGPQIQVSRIAPEFLVQLFQKEVPEINIGNIEIMGAARDPGLRAKIAVRTFDPRIDPVGACVGMRGSRVQGVMNELAGERIDIVLWDEDAVEYVRKAMAPAVIVDTFVESDKKIIDIAVPEEKLPQAVGRGGQNVRLASELTGWTINVLSENEFSEKRKSMQNKYSKVLAEKLGIDETSAIGLLEAGYEDLESIAYAEREDLLAIASLDEKSIDVIMEKATDYLLAQAFEVEDNEDEEMNTSVEDIDFIDQEIADKLLANQILTQEDLAELAVDELVAIAGLEKEEASALILKAREPWFR